MPTWVNSEPADQGKLTAQQIQQWREQGFTLVHDLLPRKLLEQSVTNAYQHFPEPGTQAATKFQGFGSDQKFVFPSPVSDATNQVTLNNALLSAVAALLDVEVDFLRLTQSDLWPKYGRTQSDYHYDNTDQRIHCDYPNHYLTHPPHWDSPEAVEIIIYLSDYADFTGSGRNHYLP